MNAPRFWRCLAILAVVGLFYVGCGLHATHEVPSMLSAAHAQGTATAVLPRQSSNNYLFVTSGNGKVVHVWRVSSGGTLTYDKKYDVPE